MLEQFKIIKKDNKKFTKLGITLEKVSNQLVQNTEKHIIKLGKHLLKIEKIVVLVQQVKILALI
jgi:hypothetical protein